ncbi:MAG: hypothetical protein ABL967_02705 [Bryobacteraceae bacterium]
MPHYTSRSKMGLQKCGQTVDTCSYWGKMIIGAAIAGFFIIALLLQTIASPPKD